jgi:membrane fusion protein, multidrug efflux system
MAKRMILMLIGLAVLFGLLFGWNVFKQSKIKQKMASFMSPAITIATAQAQAQTWTPYLTSTGNLHAVNGVALAPQIDGTIQAIYFTPGTEVAKGDALIRIDDSTEQANLKNYQAQLKLAQLNYDRDVKLLKKGAVSASAVDTDLANLEEAQSNVDLTQAQIDYKNIKAPFSGLTGIQLINVGQYVKAGDEIVSLQALNPLFIQFSLPEQNISQLHKGQAVTLQTDAFPDETFQGAISALNSEISSETATLTIQATVQNPDKKLLPGMFTTVQVMLPSKENVVTVPQTAITYNLYGDSIYVVTDSTNEDGEKVKKAALKYVTVGDRHDNVVTLTKGINAGDTIVSAGQIKLNDGDTVTINNSMER